MALCDITKGKFPPQFLVLGSQLLKCKEASQPEGWASVTTASYKSLLVENKVDILFGG